MSKVCIVKNVENTVTKEKGELAIICYKYTEKEWAERSESKTTTLEDSNKGVVIFFKANDQWKYIKSFVITEKERGLLANHDITLVKDIGYMLNYTNACLDIYDFGSHDTGSRTPYKDYKGEQESYCMRSVANWSFELDIPNEQWNNDNRHSKVVKEYKALGYTGIAKAVITALKNPVENDFIVPNTLPMEVNADKEVFIYV